MSLQIQRWEKENQNWKIENFIYKIYPNISVEKRISYKNRILDMDRNGSHINIFLKKSNSLTYSEKENVERFINKNIPIEEIIFYIDSPREKQADPRILTRSNLIDKWKAESYTLEESRSEDWVKRKDIFLGTYPFLPIGIPLLAIEIFSLLHPNFLTHEIKKYSFELLYQLQDKLEGFGPITLVASAFFIAPLYKKWKQQQPNHIHPVFLSPNFKEEGMQAFLNDDKAFEKLKEIDIKDQVLLKHLSQEKLRFFLLSKDEVRVEILKANPPIMEQKIQNLLAHHPIKGMKAPLDFIKLIFELSKTAVAPTKKVIVEEFIDRLQNQRKKNNKETISVLPKFIL